jgi:uncharacterized protein (DUF608 family)
MATQQVRKTERQTIKPTSRRVPSKSIPSTFARAAFPLGGIGTGNVSLGARGELRDWELDNSPAKGRQNANAFFAIHACPKGGVAVNRVLEARIGGDPRRDQQGGFQVYELAGLPRLASARLIGEYPIARVEFEDPELPVRVALTSFTPFVPLDADASGIPATVLRYSVTNPGDVPVSVTIVGSLSHIAGEKNFRDLVRAWYVGGARQTVSWRDDGEFRGLDFGVDLDPGDKAYGTMSLMTRAERVTKKPEWVRSFAGAGAELFWRDFAADGLLDETDGTLPVEEVMPGRVPNRTTGSLGIVADLAPGKTHDFEFVLAWSFPNRPNSWGSRPTPPGKPETVRNHYATIWPDAWAAGAHLLRELPRLEAATRAFHDALFSSTLDPAILDAVSSTLAVLPSTTCFRIEGGWFLGWEGSFDEEGSCYGTCTHVWSYAQSVAWLFPELERSARRIDYTLEVDEKGSQPIRSQRIFGLDATAGQGLEFAHPAVDGQMGSLLRLHREWRFSGDDAFLRECWPAAVRAIEFALREWDTDKDGVLDARMHNTYDIFFYGAEPLGNIYFLAALKAMAAMARHLGEAAAAERYEEAWARSSAAIDTLLYNGEYFEQRLDDVDEHRYQFGTGVLSDQTLGQFHAHLTGLGYVLPKEHVRNAVAAVFRHNFRPDLSHEESVQRAYALGNEGGLVTASWPRGGRPRIPFIYSDEVWTGIEYQVAAQLIFEGFVEEGLTVVRAARARHTGEFRSPWDDIEAGHHYARSLAAWALLIAASGVQYDGIARTLSFDPIADGLYPFTTGTAWGVATIAGDDVKLDVRGGRLDVASLSLRGRPSAS